MNRPLVFQDDVYVIRTLHDGEVYVPLSEVAPHAPTGLAPEALANHLHKKNVVDIFNDYVDPSEVEGIGYLNRQWVASPNEREDFLAFGNEEAAWDYLHSMHPEVVDVVLSQLGTATVAMPSKAGAESIAKRLRLFGQAAQVQGSSAVVDFTPAARGDVDFFPKLEALVSGAAAELRRLGYNVTVH
jgi:hypothetical protein